MFFLWIFPEEDCYYGTIDNIFHETISTSPTFKTQEQVIDWTKERFDMFKIMNKDDGIYEIR